MLGNPAEQEERAKDLENELSSAMREKQSQEVERNQLLDSFKLLQEQLEQESETKQREEKEKNKLMKKFKRKEDEVSRSRTYDNS